MGFVALKIKSGMKYIQYIEWKKKEALLSHALWFNIIFTLKRNQIHDTTSVLQVKKQRIWGTKSYYLKYILPGSKALCLDMIAFTKFMYPPNLDFHPPSHFENSINKFKSVQIALVPCGNWHSSPHLPFWVWLLNPEPCII